MGANPVSKSGVLKDFSAFFGWHGLRKDVLYENDDKQDTAQGYRHGYDDDGTSSNNIPRNIIRGAQDSVRSGAGIGNARRMGP